MFYKKQHDEINCWNPNQQKLLLIYCLKTLFVLWLKIPFINRFKLLFRSLIIFRARAGSYQKASSLFDPVVVSIIKHTVWVRGMIPAVVSGQLLAFRIYKQKLAFKYKIIKSMLPPTMEKHKGRPLVIFSHDTTVKAITCNYYWTDNRQTKAWIKLL